MQYFYKNQKKLLKLKLGIQLQVIIDLSQKFSIKIIGTLIIIISMIMMNFGSNLLSAIVGQIYISINIYIKFKGFIYPAYASFKALESANREQ